MFHVTKNRPKCVNFDIFLLTIPKRKRSFNIHLKWPSSPSQSQISFVSSRFEIFYVAVASVCACVCVLCCFFWQGRLYISIQVCYSSKIRLVLNSVGVRCLLKIPIIGPNMRWTMQIFAFIFSNANKSNQADLNIALKKNTIWIGIGLSPILYMHKLSSSFCDFIFIVTNDWIICCGRKLEYNNDKMVRLRMQKCWDCN